MRETTRVRKLERLSYGFIWLVAISQQDAAVAFQQASRDRTCPGGIVVKQHDALAWRTSRSHPHPVIGGGFFVTVKHLKARLIAVNERSFQQMLVQQVDQGHEMRAAEPDHPAGHRRASQINAQSLELPFLAIQRKAIDELRGDDMGQQRRRGQALGEDLHGDRRDRDAALTAGAGVLGPNVADHADLRGLEVQLLKNFFPDTYQGSSVGGADLLLIGQVVHDLYPRQRCGKLPAATLAALVGGDRNALGCALGGPGEGFCLVEQPCLIRVALFRWGLFGGAAEDLRLEPAVLFLEQLDALIARLRARLQRRQARQ